MKKRLRFKGNEIRWLICGLAITVLVAAGIYGLFYKNNYKADTTTPSPVVTATAPVATISVDPPTKNMGLNETLTASVVIDGVNQNYTTFRANVALTNFTVQSITVDPRIQWKALPTATNPSFHGGVPYQIYGKLTAYSMVLKPINTGNASISISNGSVLQTDGFTTTEILASVAGGTYVIADTTPPTVILGTDTDGYPSGPTAQKPVTLTSTVSNAVSFKWEKISGPTNGAVTFSSTTTKDTTATFSLPGVYKLRLTVTSPVNITAYDEINVTIHKNGDINYDGLIDNQDFALLLYNWGTTPKANYMADLSWDQKVDGNDFTILMSQWGL